MHGQQNVKKKSFTLLNNAASAVDITIITSDHLQHRYESVRVDKFWGCYGNLKGDRGSTWLRCCATNRNVAGSIPAGVSGLFIDIKSL